MKKLLAFIISCTVFLTGCSAEKVTNEEPEISSEIQTETVCEEETETNFTESTEPETVTEVETKETEEDSYVEFETVDTNSEEYIENLGFMSLKDENFMDYIEDTVYSDLVNQLNSDDYFVENVEAVYISKEYLDELAYNSQENIYFGYKLSELDEAFQGQEYIFTLGENGKTDVEPFEEYDGTFETVARNVAIGTGVILLCVTVSAVTVGAGAPAVSMVFAASAKSATVFALSSGVISGVSAGAVEGIQMGDFEKSLKEAAVKGSEGFMWGACAGAVIGGIGEGAKLSKAGGDVTDAILSNKSPKIGRESEKYAKNFFKNGKEQVSYLNKKEVNFSTKGATRPDIVLEKENGAIEAVEVKNYDLKNHLNGLVKELKRQVSDRKLNLPDGSTQRIALVTKGRGYSKEFTDSVVETLQKNLFESYGGNIPVTVLG